MGKMVTLLVVLVLIAGAAYYFMNAETESADTPAKANKDAPRVEEKYGVTSSGVGG